jgi:hypothetical protein
MRARSPEVLQEEIVQRIRIARLKQAQEEELWIINLKKYLKGDVLNLSAEEAKLCGRLADRYEVDEEDLLFFCPANATQDADRETVAKLVGA